MYFIILFTAIFLIIGLNLGFNFSMYTALNLLVVFAIILLPSLIVAILIRILPKKWFDYRLSIFQPRKYQKHLYEKLGIKKWKDSVPELGKSAGFSKKNLTQPDDPEYIKHFLNEICYGEVLHITCMISALIGLIFVPKGTLLTMGLPVAIVYFIYNIPSLMILRYNRPRLLKLLKFLEKNKSTEKGV